MRFAVLIVLALTLPTVAHAGFIRGQVHGTTPQMRFGNWLESGTPYVLDFTINTNTAAFTVSLFIDGSDQDYMRGEGQTYWGDPAPMGNVRPAGASSFWGTSTLAEDSLTRAFPFLPDAAFGIAIAVPGKYDASSPPDQRLAGMKFSDISGVSFGFQDLDEWPVSLVMFADNAKPVPVPEPSAFVLGLFGIAGLWGCRKLGRTSKVGG